MTDTPLYRIKDWNDLYETHDTRKLVHLHWTPLPNKFDGSKYAELVDHANGAEHYAAWCAILSVASRAKRGQRGYLVKGDGTPHTAAGLARVTRLPERIFTEAIPRLIQLGWVELADALPKVTGRIDQDDD